MKKAKYGWCSPTEIKIFGELDNTLNKTRRTILNRIVLLLYLKKKEKLSRLIGNNVKDKNFI